MDKWVVDAPQFSHKALYEGMPLIVDKGVGSEHKRLYAVVSNFNPRHVEVTYYNKSKGKMDTYTVHLQDVLSGTVELTSLLPSKSAVTE